MPLFIRPPQCRQLCPNPLLTVNNATMQVLDSPVSTHDETSRSTQLDAYSSIRNRESMLPDVNLNMQCDTNNNPDISVKEEFKGIMLKPITTEPNFASNLRHFTVFNLFSDLARFIGLKSRKKTVHFPDEVIRLAEDKGETSPDGNIPLTNFPYRATYSQKKPKVVRVTRGAEFKPRLAWIEDTSKCEVQYERLVTSCNCVSEYQDPKTVLKEKAKKKKQHKDAQPKLTKVTESFMYHVNIADFFLIGHKTRTLESALVDVDGVQNLKRNHSGKELLATPSPGSIGGGAVAQCVDETKSKSATELYEYTDELPPLSKSRLGKLSLNVWIFGACIPLLFMSDDVPTEASYRRIMGHFAGLAMSANEAARDLIQQSKDFHNYAFEAMRVIRALQIKIFLQGETSIKQPLSMGSGLQISRKANLSSPPPFHIFVAKITNMDEPLQFKLFEDLGSTQKINALKNLVTSTLVEFDHAKHQIDFLVDDVKETTYDSKNDTDLLYRLSEMYHCVVNISTKSQTNPTERTMAELKVICETMSKFVLSLNSFINASEHIMEKIMEVRDVVQLTYIYLQEEVKIDLSKLMPPDTPVRIVSKMGLSVNKKTGCCSGRNAKKRLKKDLQTPHYNGSDFHRVYYEDSFKDGDDTVVDGYVFRVRPAVQQKDSERRSKDYNVYPQIRFRHSEPNAVGIFGGGGNSHTTISGESLPGGGRADNSTGGTSNTLAVEETPLKPILKDVPVNSTPSPVGKLPRSPAGSIEMMPSLTKSKQLEEDDEPMLERKGKDSIIFKKDKDGSRKGSGGSNHS